MGPMDPRRLRRWLGLAVVAAAIAVDVVVLRMVADLRSPEPTAAAVSGDTGPFGWEPAAGGTREAEADELVGPVLLSQAPDGSLLRASLGSCVDRRRPRVAVGVPTDDGLEVATTTVPGLAQVTGVLATDDGLRIAGLDEKCRPTGRTSTDDGASWASGRVPRIWRLDPGGSASTVLSPTGRVEVGDGCDPTLVQPLSEGEAVVTCRASVLMTVADDGRAAMPLATSFGLRAGAVVDGRPVLGILGIGCPAQVLPLGAVTGGGGGGDDDIRPVCLARHKAVTGMTATPDGGLLVQAGNSLFGLDRLDAPPRLVSAAG